MDSYVDAPFVLTLIAMLCFASVWQKATPRGGGKDSLAGVSRSTMLVYDLIQVVVNASVAVRLSSVFFGSSSSSKETNNSNTKDFFGFQTQNTPDLQKVIWWHYWNKWLDVGFTCLLIVAGKWGKLNTLHFFHQATIGPVWWYVLRNVDNVAVAAYGFGALVNSCVQLALYLHFALKASNVLLVVETILC